MRRSNLIFLSFDTASSEFCVQILASLSLRGDGGSPQSTPQVTLTQVPSC